MSPVFTPEETNQELRAGIFVTVILSLLIVALLWLRFFAVVPAMKVTAKFKEPGPLASGMNVYYKGVNIGKAKKIYFSKDFRNTLVDMEIYQQGLKLPSNITTKIQTEGITGQKYLAFVFPENPSSQYLSDGSIIKGKDPFTLNELQEYIEKLIAKGTINSILNETEKSARLNNRMLTNFNRVSELIQNMLSENRSEIKQIIHSGAESANSLSASLQDVNSMVRDPQTKTGVKTSIQNANMALARVNKLFSSGKVDQSIDNINAAAQMAQTSLGNINGLVTKTGTVVDQIGDTGSGSARDIKSSLLSTTFNINAAAKRFDCVNQSFSNMASRRFLMFKLIFGRPGEAFDRCEYLQNYAKNK